MDTYEQNVAKYQQDLFAQRQAYRAMLVATEQKIQEDLDKTVVSLSGGALGVSFIFLKDIVGGRPILYPSVLMLAWALWAASIVAVLGSYYVGTITFRKTISQVDDGTIDLIPTPGGGWFHLSTVLNVASGLLFVAGVAAMMIFVRQNLG